LVQTTLAKSADQRPKTIKIIPPAVKNTPLTMARRMRSNPLKKIEEEHHEKQGGSGQGQTIERQPETQARLPEQRVGQ